MAILDTNILIDLMRRHPSAAATRSVEAVRGLVAKGEAIMTTRFNAAELYVGAELSSDPPGESAKVDRMLASVGVLDFDDLAARMYGKIEADLRRSGRTVGDVDALIASVALSNGHRLVTRNPRHFTGIPGLSVVPV